MSLRVSFGANTTTLQGQDGRSIGDIRDDVEAIFGMAGDESAKLDGVDAGNDAAVRDGQHLEFVKTSGSKG